MKQTAVQWLVEQYLKRKGFLKTSDIDQALKMEKEQKHESVNAQVNILKDTLDDMMTGFDSEEDRIDFILDICNGYRNRVKSE